MMGKIFEPEDFFKKRKKVIEEAAKDLSPGLRESVIKIFESWKGEELERRLVKLLGGEEARLLLKKIKNIQETSLV